jgi:type IV secretory pathway component VirB8
MCDARYRESLLETINARMEAKFARWERERTERIFRVVVVGIWIAAIASLVLAIALPS